MVQLDADSISTTVAIIALLASGIISTTVTAVMAKRTAAELATVNTRVGELERSEWARAGYERRIAEEKAAK